MSRERTNGSDCSADGAARPLDAGGGPDLDTERRRSQRVGQGDDDDQFSRRARAQFVDGDDDRGTRLARFASPSRAESDEPDVPAARRLSRRHPRGWLPTP